MRRSVFETFLLVKFVDILEKSCVSCSELLFLVRNDGRYSSNVKSSLQWSAWLVESLNVITVLKVIKS